MNNGTIQCWALSQMKQMLCKFRFTAPPGVRQEFVKLWGRAGRWQVCGASELIFAKIR